MKVSDEIIMENGLAIGFTDPMKTLFPDHYLRPINPFLLKGFEEKLKIAIGMIPPLQTPVGLDEGTFRTLAVMYALAKLSDMEADLQHHLKVAQQRQKEGVAMPYPLQLGFNEEEFYRFIEEVMTKIYELKAKQNQPPQPQMPMEATGGGGGVANQLGLPPLMSPPSSQPIADYEGAVRRHKV